MVGLDSQARIAPLVSRAISLFDSLLSALEERTAETPVAVSHYSRFKLWVGSVGAHRPSGGRSLEYRLRDASSMKNQIISLLEDLCDSVAQGIPAAQGAADSEHLEHTDDSPVLDSTDAELEDYFQDDGDVEQSKMGRVLDDIRHVVDCLLRLSMAIRNPAPHDHFLSRVKADAVDHFEEWDIKHVREKFPNADTGIAERLGRASARRRHYLRYREEHTQKIAEGIESVVGVSEADEREKATTIASSIPSHLKEGRVGAQSTAQLTGFSDSESIISMTSYAASTSNSRLLRVPPLPKGSEAGPFKCPFCCMIVSIKTRRDWKKHVFRDLRPYVCVYQSCTKPDQQYQRRADWIDHMKQEHWRTWKCPFGCPGTFASPRDFGNHINEDHPREIQAPSLDALQTLTSNADSSKAKGDCALCRDFRVASERQYGSHVGTHLEQLSLFALPHTGDHDDESGDESGGDVRSRDANESSESESAVNRQLPVKLVDFGYQNAKSRGGRGRKGKKGLCRVAGCYETLCSASFDGQEGFSRYCPQHTCFQVLTPAEEYYCPISKDPAQRLCPQHLESNPLGRVETGGIWFNSSSRTPASDRPPSPLYVSDDEDSPRAIQHLDENRRDAVRKEETTVEGRYTINCICNTSEDDGNTIYCERCDTWQHIQCYYPGNVEEALREDFSHSCADCEPRPLDRKQAIDRQTERVVRRYVEPLDSQDKSQSEPEESSGEEGEVAGSMQASPGHRSEMDSDEGNESPLGHPNSQPRPGLASHFPTTSASLDQLPMPSYDTQERLPLPQSTGIDSPQDVKARLDDIDARFLEFKTSCEELIKNYETQSEEFIKNYETQNIESRRRILLQAAERIQLRLRAIATEDETLEARKVVMVLRAQYIEGILEKVGPLRRHMGPD